MIAKIKPVAASTLVLLGSACVQASQSLDDIKLPPGFSIEVYSDQVPNARSLAMGAQGTLFVGTRTEGKVYALQTRESGEKVVHTIASDLNMPNGVAFHEGDLYVAEVSRILRFDDIESSLASPPAPQIIDGFPTDRHHGWKYIAFGPDGKLYVPIGAPCNICDEQGYAVIIRMNADGSAREVFARGVRNTVGFTWHPGTGEMWFTDNGRDWLGDDQPPCELNRAEKAGLHFGYPFCHGGTIEDPEFGHLADCSDAIAPAAALGPHVAPLGVKFYTGMMFPAEYRNQIFIAEHGSWNRSEKIGYRIVLVRLDGNRAISYEPFAEGWLRGDEVSGRPVDLMVLDDGSMLVSDDEAGAIYRITYSQQ